VPHAAVLASDAGTGLPLAGELSNYPVPYPGGAITMDLAPGPRLLDGGIPLGQRHKRLHRVAADQVLRA
jgi:hypothetical protein